MTFRAISQFRKGETIFMEGTEGNWVYKIITGNILICRAGSENNKNKQIPLAKLGPGELFGEMFLFEENKKRNASAIVISNLASLELYPQSSMLEMLTPLNPITLNIFEYLSQRLLKTSSKFITVLPKKAVANAKPVDLKEGKNVTGDKLT
ncbi:MAG: cyclic nucleotide-binding domain-containing protein [Cyanobacteria bacterium P01_H01_bin.74]